MRNKLFAAHFLIGAFSAFVVGNIIMIAMTIIAYFEQDPLYLATKILTAHQTLNIIALNVVGCYYFIKSIIHLVKFIKINQITNEPKEPSLNVKVLTKEEVEAQRRSAYDYLA